MKELDSTLMICSNCGEPIQKEIELLGKVRVVPIACSCKKAKLEKQREKDLNTEKQERLKRLFSSSLMDKKFMKETFEAWDHKKGSEQMFNIGNKYCENFKAAKKEGLGFLIYGPPGNGKTYLSNCIANNLLNKGIPVICLSINALLERIQKTYSSWGKEGERDILNTLAYADLLIIDDLGTEQLTDWSATKIYNIIDSRYRNGLPIIVSTNKSLSELKDMYHVRTVDRLFEMCTPLKNGAESIRKEQAKEKTNLLRKILL